MSAFLEALATRLASHGSAEEARQIANQLLDNIRGGKNTPIDTASLKKALGDEVLDADRNLLKALSDPKEVKRAADLLRTMNPKDYADDMGKRFIREIEERAKSLPTLRKSLEDEGLFQGGKFLGNPQAMRRVEKQALSRRNVVLLEYSAALDFTGARARKLLSTTISEIADPGLRKKFADVLEKLPESAAVSDFEELALRCRREVKGLSKEQIAHFDELVQRKACEDLMSRIDSVIERLNAVDAVKDSDRVLRTKVRDAYEKSPTAEEFRTTLYGLSEEFAVALTARLNGDAFIKGVLTVLVKDQRARRALDGFDQNGLRQLFEAWASFGKKDYAIDQSRAAGKNLIAWLYEATKFNKEEMLKASNEVFDQFAAPLMTNIKGLKIDPPTVHFDIWRSNTRSGPVSLQGADHMGTSGLTYGGQTVFVATAFGEHKGISGVAAGLRQNEKIGGRYRSGIKVSTEQRELVMGETLFTSLDDALRKLNVPDNERTAALKAFAGRDKPYRKIVIFPPDTAAGRGFRSKSGDALVVAHDVARDDMMSLYASVSTMFGLSPIKLKR